MSRFGKTITAIAVVHNKANCRTVVVVLVPRLGWNADILMHYQRISYGTHFASGRRLFALVRN